MASRHSAKAVVLGVLGTLLAACGALTAAPTATPDPACRIQPLPTGEKGIPLVMGTPPPPYAYAGQTISVSFSGGYFIPNNAIVCGQDQVVGYVHSDELPGWSDARTVALQLYDLTFAERECGHECALAGQIPATVQVGVYPLYLLVPSPARTHKFELFIVPSPTP